MTTAQPFSDDDAILKSVLAMAPPAPQRIAAHRADTGAVNWNLPGFGGKVRIGTVFGDLPIEALRVRDELRTISGSVVRVQWVDKIHLDEDFLRTHSSAIPVEIAANAFGAGKPLNAMVVSPRQEVCTEAHVASRFLTGEKIQGAFNAHRAPAAGLTYYRFHCGEPVIVRAEGVWVRIQP